MHMHSECARAHTHTQTPNENGAWLRFFSKIPWTPCTRNVHGLLTALCFMYTRWECAANLQGHNLGVTNTIHLKRVKFTKGRCVRKQNILVQPV